MFDARVALVEIVDRFLDTYNTNEIKVGCKKDEVKVC
jgi:hypothetical protein